MSRYYFDITDGDGFHRDTAGEEFDSFQDARDLCQSLLPDIAREELPDGDLHTVTCDVRNESGRVIYRGEITFRGTWFGNGDGKNDI